jgi:hypothetical protein
MDSSGEASQKYSDRKGLHLLSDGHSDGRAIDLPAETRRSNGATAKPWVILLGPLTTFLDEDVPEREVRPLFERSLKKIEEMALRGVPFLSFQSPAFSGNSPFPPFTKGRMGGLKSSKRVYLTRKLFQFSNEAWKIDLDEEGPKMILAKGVAKLQVEKSLPLVSE